MATFLKSIRMVRLRAIGFLKSEIVLASNDNHKLWTQNKLAMLFADLSTTTVAVWGLSYKPGTDSLRRSLSVELCDWMLAAGATIHVHDSLVGSLPERWGTAVLRHRECPYCSSDMAILCML